MFASNVGFTLNNLELGNVKRGVFFKIKVVLRGCFQERFPSHTTIKYYLKY